MDVASRLNRTMLFGYIFCIINKWKKLPLGDHFCVKHSAASLLRLLSNVSNSNLKCNGDYSSVIMVNLNLVFFRQISNSLVKFNSMIEKDIKL